MADDILQIEFRPPTDPEIVELLAELRRELENLYDQKNIYSIEGRQRQGLDGTGLIARRDGRAVGCGSLWPLAPGVCELKGMFVRPVERGGGVGRRILAELEAAAREGYRTARLETGTRQPRAMALYEAAGYRRRPPFGAYAADPFSVCYEKDLMAEDVGGRNR